jgi:hypothetical protein
VHQPVAADHALIFTAFVDRRKALPDSGISSDPAVRPLFGCSHRRKACSYRKEGYSSHFASPPELLRVVHGDIGKNGRQAPSPLLSKLSGDRSITPLKAAQEL